MENGKKPILRIAKAMIGSATENVPIQLNILKELSDILGYERCVIYRIYEDETGKRCKITAGVPEEEHGIGFDRPFNELPDLKRILECGCINIITNPEKSELTAHFRPTILEKGITQILYIPLFLKTSGLEGIIVVDAINKKFSKQDIEICTDAGELISLLIDNEDVLIQRVRDQIVNPVVGMSLSINRLDKFIIRMSKDIEDSIKRLNGSIGKLSVDLKTVKAEIKKIEGLFPKGKKFTF